MKPPIVVLDTNIALDWLVFEDGGMPELIQAINHRLITLVTNAACTQELIRVLAYPNFGLDATAQAACSTRYKEFALSLSPPVSLPGPVPRCRDRDDQKFLDLAVQARAAALISKDNAVLGVQRAMKSRFACEVLAPNKTRDWLRQFA